VILINFYRYLSNFNKWKLSVFPNYAPSPKNVIDIEKSNTENWYVRRFSYSKYSSHSMNLYMSCFIPSLCTYCVHPYTGIIRTFFFYFQNVPLWPILNQSFCRHSVLYVCWHWCIVMHCIEAVHSVFFRTLCSMASLPVCLCLFFYYRHVDVNTFDVHGPLWSVPSCENSLHTILVWTICAMWFFSCLGERNDRKRDCF